MLERFATDALAARKTAVDAHTLHLVGGFEPQKIYHAAEAGVPSALNARARMAKQRFALLAEHVGFAPQPNRGALDVVDNTWDRLVSGQR